MSLAHSPRPGRGDNKNFAAAASSRPASLGRAQPATRQPSVFYRAAPNAPPVIAKSSRPAPEPAPATPGWYYLMVVLVLIGGLGAIAQASRKNDVSDLARAPGQKIVTLATGLDTPRRLPADKFVKER